MELDDVLEPFGHQPDMNIFTEICSCYSVADSSAYPTLIDTLTTGHLGIPLTYPGLVQNMTYHTYTLQQLIDSPLGTIAS